MCKYMKGRNLGILHSGIEDCETIRMVSSNQPARINGCKPLRMVAACLCSATQYRETMRMVSSGRFRRIEDYETMRVVSSYRLLVALGPICAEIRPVPEQKVWPEKIAP